VEHNSQRSILPIVLTWPKRVSSRLCHAWRSFLPCIVLPCALLAVPALAPSRAAAATVANTAHFELASPTVQNGAIIPWASVGNRNDCQGGNQSPPLVWNHPPAGTGSYAVSMADLDAKVGITWLWLMFDVPAQVTTLAQNAAGDAAQRPAGAIQARNDFDGISYTGPCPHQGKLAHHYLITVWALKDASLPFKEGVPAEKVAIFLRRYALGHASLTPHYGGR
jgi:Raf kinase inhibitor-like YbhB/YbcL family protein